jgi:hypothetical protein
VGAENDRQNFGHDTSILVGQVGAQTKQALTTDVAVLREMP